VIAAGGLSSAKKGPCETQDSNVAQNGYEEFACRQHPPPQRAGKGREKKDSTVSNEAYSEMKKGWSKSKRKRRIS